MNVEDRRGDRVESDRGPRLPLPEAKVALPQYKRKLFDSRTVYFTVLALMLSGGLALVHWRSTDRSAGTAGAGSWTAEQQRAFANKLREYLPAAAGAEYEKYLTMQATTPRERSNVYYTVAKTAVEAGDFETGLAYFYKAEVAEPDGPLASEIGMGIVRCLEELGKFIDAQGALEARAGLGTAGADKETAAKGAVIARIGDRSITVSELDRAIQKLPAWAQQQYSTPDKKLEFLNQYISEQLLYEKALKLELDKDPEVREQVLDAARRAAVGKLIDRDVRNAIQIDPEDVRMFYDAHLDEFVDKARAKVRHILVADEGDAKEVLAKLATGEQFEDLAREVSLDEATRDGGGTLTGWIYADGKIPGVDDGEDMIEAIMATDVGKATEPLQDESGWHVFFVEEKVPYRQKPFEEVKDLAERRYRMMKEQEEYGRLIETTLEANDVEIFAENLDAAP